MPHCDSSRDLLIPQLEVTDSPFKGSRNHPKQVNFVPIQNLKSLRSAGIFFEETFPEVPTNLLDFWLAVPIPLDFVYEAEFQWPSGVEMYMILNREGERESI